MTEFEEYYRKYRGDMYALSRKQGVTYSVAQDCVQEAAKRLSQMSTIQYINARRVKTLFCEVAKNCTIDRLRKDAVYNETSQKHLDDEPKFTTKRERETIISITVHRALASLYDIESYIAWKWYAMEQSLKEISEDLLKDKGMKWYPMKILRFINRVVHPKLKEALIQLGGDKL